MIWFTARAWRQGCETRAAQLSCGQEGIWGWGEIRFFSADLEAPSSCHRHTETPSSAPALGLTQNIQQGQRQILPRSLEQVQSLFILLKSHLVFLVQLSLFQTRSWRLLCPKQVTKAGLQRGDRDIWDPSRSCPCLGSNLSPGASSSP